MASWLVCRTVRVRVLAVDTVLCSWTRHFTLICIVPLSIQMHKFEFNASGTRVIAWNHIQGGVAIFLVASCYRNRDYCAGPGGHLARMQTLPLLQTRQYCTWNCSFSENYSA